VRGTGALGSATPVVLLCAAHAGTMSDLVKIWDMPDDNKSVISYGTTLTGNRTARSTGGLSLGGGVNRKRQEARRRERKARQLQQLQAKTLGVYTAHPADFKPRSTQPHRSVTLTRDGTLDTHAYAPSASDGLSLRTQTTADANGIIRTPLMKAAAKGDVEEVRAMIRARVDLFEEDHKGRTALDWARVSRVKSCIECARVR